jgi:hypothetical protein
MTNMPILQALAATSPLATVAARPDDLWAVSLVVLIAVAVAIATMVIVSGCRRARGTTLFAPLVWALVSLWTLVAVATSSFGRQQQWWLVATTSTLCPLVALLGAKRPQNRAWQLIVLSFWGIAALPAIQSWLLYSGEPMVVHGLWRWLFVVLIFMGFINYRATSLWFVAFLFAAGQALIFWPFLPGISQPRDIESVLGIPAIAAVIGIAAIVIRRRKINARHVVDGWNSVWLDFRDYYGLLWSTRLAERIEALAESNNSPIWIDWDGFHSAPKSEENVTIQPLENPACVIRFGSRWMAFGKSNQLEPISVPTASHELVQTLEPGLRNLLRRFVSNGWIEKRLQETNSDAAITS